MKIVSTRHGLLLNTSGASSNMLLLQLSPEILRLIFEQIGSSFFQKDLRRLTICKQWYEFALPECLRRVVFYGDNLKRLINVGGLSQPSALRNSCEDLSLYIGGDQTRTISPSAQSFARTSTNADTSTALHVVSQDDTLANSQILNNDLVQLSLLIQGSFKLHTLYIRAWSFPPFHIRGSQRDYLSLPTMRSLLSVDHLAALVLDLPVGFCDSSEYQEAGCQLCPTIGALLGNLQSLQLRVRTICPNALKPQSHSHSLPLTKVVVNLSLSTNLPWQTSAIHSKRCGSAGGGMLQLKADLQKQAESLLPRMATPKFLRILTHSLPSIETQVLDVVTGKTMILDDNAAWDQDGRAPEKVSTPEPELSDDALAAFLDSDED
ncbi:hypothetical protein LLEC1_07652 [Akanthomyces lecanii]|uniref:F-box domain-containing protein n=1 Tax=Cordyceps confragosa TaxID=2714763 RepID=A0A179IMM3_CORDF|nr:hypothetical protein LLEC1_07652 [Akanthomyces lecanii]